MSVSYNRLWKLLIDKNMSVADMRRAADIAPNTVTRMKKDQEVTLAVLEKICAVLDADFGDIVEYKKQRLRRFLMLKDKSLTYVTLFSSAGVGRRGFQMEGYHECFQIVGLDNFKT